VCSSVAFLGTRLTSLLDSLLSRDLLSNGSAAPKFLQISELGVRQFGKRNRSKETQTAVTLGPPGDRRFIGDTRAKINQIDIRRNDTALRKRDACARFGKVSYGAAETLRSIEVRD